MINQRTTIKHILILAGLCYLFFMWGNGVLDLTNPDEVFYAQTAREMVQQKTWLVPYLFGAPQFEKPIFTYWCLRLGFMLFGTSGFGARFFPALFAMLGVLVLYGLAFLGYHDRRKAFISAIILLSGGLYIGLARTVFTDMIFSVFILFSLASFYWGYTDRQKKGIALLLFFFFVGLAVLTKGPLGFILPCLSIVLFLAIRRELRFFFCGSSFLGFLIMLAVSLPWYVYIIRVYGDGFIREFFYNDHIRRIYEAEHLSNDTWYFYPLSMIMCMFPWSFFTAAAFFNFFKNLRRLREWPAFSIFLFSWIVAVLVIFQVAHSKLVSYIFPLFPALALITGDFVQRVIFSQKTRVLGALSFISWLTVLCIPVGVLISSRIYAEYVPSRIPVYGFVSFCAVLLGVMILLIRRKKFMANMYFLALQVPLLLSFVFFSHENLNAFAASKGAAAYLLKNESVSNTILCAKFFARGVRFYTDKDVAVVDMGGAGYFSAHPIPYLNTEEKLRDFLEKQTVTFGIVNKGALESLEKMGVFGFKLEKLKKIGDEFVVKIEHII